jgi:hypothetical protein
LSTTTSPNQSVRFDNRRNETVSLRISSSLLSCGQLFHDPPLHH